LRNRALIGLNAIRMELHWRERRLANERLLHAVTAALGYPDLQTLCVAVADRVVSAARVADLLIEEAEGAAVLAPVPETVDAADAIAAEGRSANPGDADSIDVDSIDADSIDVDSIDAGPIDTAVGAGDVLAASAPPGDVPTRARIPESGATPLGA